MAPPPDALLPQTSGLETELLRLRALAEASRLVFSSLDLDQLLDNILKAATSILGAARGTVYVCDHASRELWSRVTAGAERVEIRLPFGKGMAGHTALTGQPLRVDDVHASPLFDAAVDRRTGFHTENALCMPIRDRDGKTVSVLQLLNKPGGFTDADTHFLDLMAVQIAQALANARAQQGLVERQRLNRELELAAEIQTRLLPAVLPSLPGYSMAARMTPSRQIGGDYYDAVPLADGRMLMVLADVSGKGVPAALVMSNVQAALWATAALALPIEKWAEHMNDLLYRRLEAKRYVTAILALLDPATGKLRYVNAGHPPALLQDGARVSELGSTGPPLGLLADQSFEVAEAHIPKGGSLLLYSDGLSEAMDAREQELGTPALARILAALSGASAAQTVAQLMAAVERHADPAQDRDDRTLLLLKADRAG